MSGSDDLGGREPGWRDWAIAIVAATLWLLLVRAGPLSLPYFWDEADVYVPGSIWVAEHGLNVTPGVFPDDYSRGHPPLLYFIAGVAFALFGSTPAVGHLVVLPFTVLALAGTYLLGAAAFGRRVGVAAALLLGSTPLFLSIGAMLLPEPPLVALTVLALLMFVRGRLLACALFGSAAVLLKETGIFTAGAIAGGVLWDGWRRGALGSRETIGRGALVSAPLVVLCGFFLWQRLSPAGYFIFPHHQNLLWDRPLGLADLVTVFPSLLLWHGRWIVTGAAAIWLGVLAAQRRLWVADRADGSGRWRPSTSAVVVALLLLVTENALFFTKMFWLERYALPAHPGVVILAAAVLLGGFTRPQRAPLRASLIAPWVAIAVTFVLGLASLRLPTDPNEEELTFAHADVIETHQRAYEAIERQLEQRPGLGRDPLIVTSWPMTVELRDPRLGYVDRRYRTRHIDSMSEDGASLPVDMVLVAERSRHSPALRHLAERLQMRRVGRFRRGHAQAIELWIRP